MKRVLIAALCAASLNVIAATSDKEACIAIAAKQKEGVCNLSGLSRNDAKEVLQAAVFADPSISPRIDDLGLLRRAGDVFKGMAGLNPKEGVCLNNKHQFSNC